MNESQADTMIQVLKEISSRLMVLTDKIQQK